MAAQEDSTAKKHFHKVFKIRTTAMTTEEKLAKAVDFIKSIEKLDKKSYNTFSLNDIENNAYAYCDECDCSVNAHLQWPSSVKLSTEYIDWKVIYDLSDKAWHVLASIAE